MTHPSFPIISLLFHFAHQASHLQGISKHCPRLVHPFSFHTPHKLIPVNPVIQQAILRLYNEQLQLYNEQLRLYNEQLQFLHELRTPYGYFFLQVCPQYHIIHHFNILSSYVITSIDICNAPYACYAYIFIPRPVNTV